MSGVRGLHSDGSVEGVDLSQRCAVGVVTRHDEIVANGFLARLSGYECREWDEADLRLNLLFLHCVSAMSKVYT